MSRFSQQMSVSTAPISNARSVSLDAEAELARVLANLVEVTADQLLLLKKER